MKIFRWIDLICSTLTFISGTYFLLTNQQVHGVTFFLATLWILIEGISDFIDTKNIK